MPGSGFCLSFSISGSDPVTWPWKALLCCRIGIQPFHAIPFLLSVFQNFLIYMMFLLVVLLTNYGDASRTSRAFLLQSSIKQQLGSNDFLLIKRYLPAPGGIREVGFWVMLHSLCHKRFLGAHVELGTP